MTTTTLTLPGFLLVRIAEDEDYDHVPMPSMEHEAGSCGDCGGVGATRWLAECEAKRQIVEIHRPHSFADGPIGCAVCTQWDDYPHRVEHGVDAWPCATLRALAVPYADHPGYREEWRP